jgi:hypothetical protein
MSSMDGYAFGGMLSTCRPAAWGQKKIASAFVSPEDCSLQARKVLRDLLSPYHEPIGQARNAVKEH